MRVTERSLISAGGTRRRTARVLTLAVSLAWLVIGHAIDAQEKAFLWRVSKDNHSIYLLGSIHYLRKENFPLHKSIIDAFDASKLLVLEIDLNRVSPDVAQRVTLEKAVYRDGQTLRQNISQETYQLAEQHAAKLGIDMRVMAPMKPWFVALTLVAIKFQQIGLDPNLGVDHYLAERAKSSGKSTSGLETLEFQIGLLDQMSERDQESLLRETVGELDLLDTNINQIVQAWLKGDGQSLEALLLAGMKEYPEVHEKIIVDRNRRWVPQIEKILAQSDGAMVVVGAAHLVGKDGVIEMLKARGYRLEQR
ncbi:MAG TPA: TraB/GumN family protein [Candidatus Binatia bacterium]